MFAMVRNSKCLNLCFLFFGIGFGSLGPSTVWAKHPVKVFVSILPQKYFVEKIGDGLVDVSVMVQPGASPHNYEPKPRQMAALGKTGVYFAIGVNFEEVWLKKIAAINPGMRIVHTDKGIDKIPMAGHLYPDEEGHTAHPRPGQHKQGKVHQEDGHGLLDPHIWTSPPLVKIQARNILRELIAVDSANRTTYQANYRKFIEEIDTIDREFQTIFTGKSGLEFMVFHPTWGYFAKTYGLKEVPIEIEGKKPKPAQLKRLIEYAGKRGIKVIFVQPQISAKSARTIAKAIGGQVVIANPLAENWMENLRQLAEKFRSALR